MKLRMLFYFIFILVLSSCSSLSEEPPSISITSDKSTLEVGETVTLTVVDDEDDNITSQSTILVNGEAISGSAFTPADAGNFGIKATYLSVNSDVIYVRANAPVILSSIVVTLSSTPIFIGNTLTLAATAVYTDDSTVDITSEAEFYVDDVLVSGNQYTGVQVGTIEVKAVFE